MTTIWRPEDFCSSCSNRLRSDGVCSYCGDCRAAPTPDELSRLGFDELLDADARARSSGDAGQISAVDHEFTRRRRRWVEDVVGPIFLPGSRAPSSIAIEPVARIAMRCASWASFGGLECGGIAVGFTDRRGTVIVDVTTPANQERGRDRVLLDFGAGYRLARESGLDVVGAFHTHPSANSTLSPTDLRAMRRALVLSQAAQFVEIILTSGERGWIDARMSGFVARRDRAGYTIVEPAHIANP